MTDDEISRLMEAEEARHKAEMQRLREKLAYNLGRKRFMEKQAEALGNQLHEQDAKEARP